MQFSNDGINWSPRESYGARRESWDLAKYGGDSEDGEKKVFVRFVDGVGNATDPPIPAFITLKSFVSGTVQIFAPRVEGKIKSGDLVRVEGKADPGGAML